ncbi:MAG: hypothetical protein QOF98_1933, partial [Streptomyces sp.]|nr:hypothetical protein [Streptomyces sp.]
DVIEQGRHGEQRPAPATAAARARLASRITVVSAVVGLAAMLGGPIAYSVDTTLTAHTGATPTAGPTVAGAGFGGGIPKGFTLPGDTGTASGGTGTAPGGTGTGGFGGGGGGGMRGGGGFGGFGGGTGTAPGGTGTAPGGTGTAPGGTGTGTAPGGAAGGGRGETQISSAMKTLLEQDADQYRWVAAINGSQSQAGYQLATGDSVMPIGGFSGTDPSPTLAQFEDYVAKGEIHYYIVGGGFGGGGGGAAPGGQTGGTGTTAPGGTGTGTAPGGTDTAPGGTAGGFGGGGAAGGTASTGSQISSWVESHFTAKTVDGVTVYDLTAPTSSTTS